MEIQLPSPKRLYVPLEQVEKNIFVFAPLPNDKSHCAFVLSVCILKDNKEQCFVYPRYWNVKDMEYFLNATGVKGTFEKVVDVIKSAGNVDDLISKLNELQNSNIVKLCELTPNDCNTIFEFYDYMSSPLASCEPPVYSPDELDKAVKELMKKEDEILEGRDYGDNETKNNNNVGGNQQ